MELIALAVLGAVFLMGGKKKAGQLGMSPATRSATKGVTGMVLEVDTLTNVSDRPARGSGSATPAGYPDKLTAEARHTAGPTPTSDSPVGPSYDPASAEYDQPAGDYDPGTSLDGSDPTAPTSNTEDTVQEEY